MSLTSHRRLRSQPRLETLEDRKLLYSTLGAGWTFGSRITMSLVPDGTNIGGQSSVLFQSLGNRGISSSATLLAFQKAAAAWQAVTNINIAFVSDSGESLGVPGYQQGDSRFGDIRIGGTGQASNVLASCFLPAPINGGTVAGDIVFNTNQLWRVNNDFDLQTVAIHEIGHSLGMDHSALTSAVMYSAYTGMKQTLSSDDIAGIVSVYGARSPDMFDASGSNGSYMTATNLTSFIDTSKQIRLAGLDITSSADQDWYVFTAPAGASNKITVTMQSSNLSLLSPRVTLFSGSLQTLGTDADPNSYGSTVSTTFTGVIPGQTYYVRAQAASGGTSGIGAYGLLVNFGTGSMSPIDPPNTVVLARADHGGGGLNQTIDPEDLVSIGTLDGAGESMHSVRLPPRRELKAIFGFGYQFGKDNDFELMIAPPVLAKLKKIEAKGNRQELARAIDDVLASWDE